eukprot:TRINITY_DN38078_c0_g1_i1.p1 TRINITY_DN38078_c0_g1~~TRINITY_DN38078_c0_g1_i1.p1  ORF type:complete len:183 (+),score=27.04 TRINITY_DN38078_c0_g1_i1:76-624(+)
MRRAWRLMLCSSAVATVTAWLGRQFTSAFVPAARHVPAVTDHQQSRRAWSRRRDMVMALGFSAGLAEHSAWAAKDARTDSICTYKCLDVCREKAPNNEEYCQTTCASYCKNSVQEKDLKTGVEKGGMADKILMKARKTKFDDRRTSDKKVGKVDYALGNIVSMGNETDYKNGIKESVSSRMR